MSKKTQIVYLEGIRARGEPARMILGLSGAPHEQVNIPFSDWPARKKEMPMGQVPLLIAAEGALNQSNSIARYLAKKHGFVGKDLWSEAENDAMVENIMEVVNTIPGIYGWMVFGGAEKPADWEAQLSERKEKWIKILNVVQKHAESKKGKFCNGSELQLCDIFLYCSLEFSKKAVPDAFTLTTWTQKFVATFEAEPKVKKYLAERPSNSFGV